MTEAEEATYVLGRKAMARDLLAYAIRELGSDAPDSAILGAPTLQPAEERVHDGSQRKLRLRLR
jgi:hypothetical protein